MTKCIQWCYMNKLCKLHVPQSTLLQTHSRRKHATAHSGLGQGFPSLVSFWSLTSFPPKLSKSYPRARWPSTCEVSNPTQGFIGSILLHSIFLPLLFSPSLPPSPPFSLCLRLTLLCLIFINFRETQKHPSKESICKSKGGGGSLKFSETIPASTASWFQPIPTNQSIGVDNPG